MTRAAAIRVEARSQAVVGAARNGFHILKARETVIEESEDPRIVVRQRRRERRTGTAVAALNSRIRLTQQHLTKDKP